MIVLSQNEKDDSLLIKLAIGLVVSVTGVLFVSSVDSEQPSAEEAPIYLFMEEEWVKDATEGRQLMLEIELDEIEAERIELARIEAERIEAEKLEEARLLAEKIAEEERLEAERLAEEQREKERLAQVEAERQEKEQKEAAAKAEEATYEEVKTTSSNSQGTLIGTFQSTAYAVGAWGVPGTVTRNGTDISNTIYSPEGYRIIAADPNVIPLNSVVTVHVPGWEPFKAIVADTGGMIKGNIIDILMASPQEALNFGRQNGIKIYR